MVLYNVKTNIFAPRELLLLLIDLLLYECLNGGTKLIFWPILDNQLIFWLILNNQLDFLISIINKRLHAAYTRAK